MLKKCRKDCVLILKQYICKAIRHKTKTFNMKKLVNYFTPRNADERNTLGGLFVGILIVLLIITLIP